MSFQIFSWVTLLFYLLPIVVSGIFILRKVTTLTRFELLLPVGSIIGISLFAFFTNLLSFIKAGRPSIIAAYLFTIILGFLAFKLKVKLERLTYPTKKSFLFYIISTVIWGIFVFWKGNNALIGSDSNLYYSIAHTFLKGNFPSLTPWQPDIPLTYHIGSSQFLAAFYLFTNLSFEFLHVFFSCVFIFISSQIIIWFYKRHQTITSFIFANIFAAIIFISFGFFKVIFPYFPLKLLQINSLRDLFFWIRNLPTVNQSIEVYGAAVNLDSLIYFIFHAHGLALAFGIIVLTVFQNKDKFYLSWTILSLSVASLALINEFLVLPIALAVVIGCFMLSWDIIRRNLKISFFILISTITIILFQGGIITNTLSLEADGESSILFFPNKGDIKEDFAKYHYYQEISKSLEYKKEWLPFRWYSIGVDLLVFVPLIFLIFIKSPHNKNILIFYFAGLFSLIAYNFIVPKFVVANGNRLLAFAFLFLSIATLLCMQIIIENTSKKLIKIISLLVLTFFVLLPTLLPPLFLLTKNRFPEKKLVARAEQKTEGINWIERKLPFFERIMVLDLRTPHPSGQVRAMVQAGVFAPVFPGDYKAYTIEASPEYFDIAYNLNPIILKKLKIQYLLIDSDYFRTIVVEKREILENDHYFQKVFDNSSQITNWEKIYKISENYLTFGNEPDGGFTQYSQLFSDNKKIYIDNEENFNPTYLRRALIFSIRNKEVYYLPQSGVYLNVEAQINNHPPLNDGNYDYFVLGKHTDPKNICQCNTKQIWQGFKNDVFVWQRI